jgi:hypothetical protein
MKKENIYYSSTIFNTHHMLCPSCNHQLVLKYMRQNRRVHAGNRTVQSYERQHNKCTTELWNFFYFTNLPGITSSERPGPLAADGDIGTVSSHS